MRNRRSSNIMNQKKKRCQANEQVKSGEWSQWLVMSSSRSLSFSNSFVYFITESNTRAIKATKSRINAQTNIALFVSFQENLFVHFFFLFCFAQTEKTDHCARGCHRRFWRWPILSTFVSHNFDLSHPFLATYAIVSWFQIISFGFSVLIFCCR